MFSGVASMLLLHTLEIWKNQNTWVSLEVCWEYFTAILNVLSKERDVSFAVIMVVCIETSFSALHCRIVW